eukprot:COSAG01_NODE_23905_length_797_cov_3.534384_1_plen_135_part_00
MPETDQAGAAAPAAQGAGHANPAAAAAAAAAAAQPNQHASQAARALAHQLPQLTLAAELAVVAAGQIPLDADSQKTIYTSFANPDVHALFSTSTDAALTRFDAWENLPKDAADLVASEDMRGRDARATADDRGA